MNFIQEIKNMYEQIKTWCRLELEYAKLTVVEKVTILAGMLIIAFMCMLVSMVILILLALALTEVYKMLMCTALAYLATAGSICVLLLLIYLLRKPLLMNPISKAVSKALFEKKK